MADNLAYKDTVAVIKDFESFINNTLSGVSGSPIADPLTDANKTRSAGTGLAVYEDNTKIHNHPKILFEVVEIGRRRQAGGKQLYRERFRHEFAIIYECHMGHTWTYNNVEHKGKQQCIKYLEYLGSKIKQYSGSFDMNEIVVGPPANPIENKKTLTYSSFMVVKADTYGKIGD